MTNQGLTKVTATHTGPERDRTNFPIRATQLVWVLFGILGGLIALRIGLMLIGASTTSQIVTMIYGFTNLFLYPFAGLIISPSAGNMVLELYSIFAILIYAMVAWVLEKIIWVFFNHPGKTVVGTNHT